jgi:hypothetical protein
MMSVGPAVIDSINLMQGQYTLSNGGFGITMADIDGDNKPELMAGNPQGGLVLFKNQIIPDGINQTQLSHSTIKCYPNPTSHLLHLQSITNNKIKACSLMNQLGQSILQQNIDAIAAELNVSEIPNGVYILKIITADGIQFEKIIKQ